MKKKLDDPVLQERLFDQIRAGHGRYAAAQIVGVNTETFRKYYRSHPEFREGIEAAIDASIEPVLRMLHDEAVAGDITAAKEWLKHNAPPPRTEKKEIEVKHTHELDPATISSIEDLRARLEGRTAPGLPAAEDDTIEGEIMDEEDNDE